MASVASYRPDRRAIAVAERLNDIDVTSLDLWDDLDALSTHTALDGVEVPVEGIVIMPENRFTAILNLYVSLQYGKDNDEGFTTSDSFLGKIAGRLVGDDPIVEESFVDTSSFYE